ncbi:MAG: sigma-54 factor interaction domain-containing protein, partial [Deltaproteobacteria bacterium]|nr:sigma-54 factor interaction domain-containing protein [Deltaproteobacteria bacterium]
EVLSRLDPKFAPPDGGVPRPLADNRLSRLPLHLTRTSAAGIVLDATDTRTPVVADGAPLEGVREFTGGEIRRGVVLLLGSRVVLVLHTMEPLVLPSLSLGLVGESAAIGRVRQEIRRVADLPFPVLLRGESGTGKELAARAIHDAGPRRDRPYLGVNLGAVPPNLAAAELFGAVKGAYTGADRPRLGYFQRAVGGTLFLDEIGEAPAEIQVHLLRALDTGQIQPVGAQVPETVDVRVVSATDADLEVAVAAGEFRSPLL